MKRFLILWALLLGLPATLVARQDPPGHDEGTRIQRLVGLARVWGECNYFHPALADRSDIDWDAALIAALPEVRRAPSTQDYAAAVGRMLSRLGDPLTRVVETPSEPPGAVVTRLGHQLTSAGVLVVTAGNYYALADPEARAELEAIAKAAGSAKAVVLDLRSPIPTEAFGRLHLSAALGPITSLLISRPVQAVGMRRRVYYGHEAASVFSSGQYRSGYFVQGAAPLAPDPKGRDVPTVFLINRYAGVLPATLPMQAAGQALIVYEGDLSAHTVGETKIVELGEGVRAQVRTARPVLADGACADLMPDAVVADSGAAEDAAMAQAMLLAEDFKPSRVARPQLPAVHVQARAGSYSEMSYPSADYRLLAAFRLWNAIEHFYPYKDLLDAPWEATLREVLPAFEAAADARQYNLAVAQMAVRLHDSHGYVSGPVFSNEIIASGYPPIRVRIIENQCVVTAVRDAEVAENAGVAIGDVVVEVDGKPAAGLLEQYASILSASTPQSKLDKASLALLSGPVGSQARLVVDSGDGQRKDVEIPRRREDYTTLYHHERSGEIIRVMPGNVGYVDLDRLSFDMVEAVFEQLKDTRGIIFDMRGYPHGTVWAIAPRLATQSRVVALFQTPTPGHSAEPSSAAFAQTLEPATPGRAQYAGRTIMLMDERTQSQAEHTGLYLKAANGTLFVGAPTAGANGEITSVTLPGGVTVGFTGQSVRFPDGRQLQRVGLTPDIEVRPTIQAIRAGRDEVLEAALRLLTREQ